jgi:hypothetical protein
MPPAGSTSNAPLAFARRSENAMREMSAADLIRGGERFSKPPLLRERSGFTTDPAAAAPARGYGIKARC